MTWPPNHHDDDEYAPCWRYQPDCGCDLCEDYEESMLDALEQDFWLDTGSEQWEDQKTWEEDE